MAAVAALKPYAGGFNVPMAPAPTDGPKEINQSAQSGQSGLLEGPGPLKREPTAVDVDAWPQQLASPMAWTGQDFKDPSTYTYHLSHDEVLEIDNALKHFQGWTPR